MTDAVKSQIKTMSIWRKIIVCLMAAMLLLTFAACGSEPAQQEPQTVAVEGKSEEQLRQQLTNGDVNEIIIQGTLYLSAPAEVVGNKTITGDGKIVAQGDWAEDAYLIRVASGTELVLAGTVTVDGKGISGGVYVSEGAALQVTEEATVRGAAEACANVLAAGAVQISGGFLSDSQGDNVRVSGTLEQNGGTISGGYNNVSVAEGASFVWNAGSNLNAKNDGVLIAQGAELKVTAAAAILKDAGAQGIHLEGKAVIDGILITGCQENQIKIEESAELTVNECTLSGSMGHGITNRGKMTMNAGDITGAVSCGIVNTGVLEVNGGGIRTNGNKGILVKNGGSLVIASENVAISGNVVGVAVEENATADISKARINSNTLNNFSCFGELYIHDMVMGGSGSNCIATNYGGHVVAKNVEIISTNGNNGIYNINGSLVELTDCTISGTKTNAIRNLDADLVATNLTISNCGGGISTGDYIFGEAGSVKIDGLTVSGVTGNNVSTEAYCGGTIELTNATLGATGSNNLSIKGGHLILTDVTVEGNRENSQGTTHGILMDEGGKITAKNVTISNAKYSAIRNRGGYFEGTNITITNVGQHAISNASHGTTKAPGVVVIRNLKTSFVGGKNVDNNSKGGTVGIYGGYLCQTTDNNVANYNGTTVVEDVKLEGTIAKFSDYLYGFMVTGGKIKAKNVEVGPCYAASIRTKGGDFEGTNITTKGGMWFAWNGGGNITVNGLTTENVTESNLKNDTDDATITITNGKLCATGNNNIRIYKGVVTLKDTDVAGQTADAASKTHGVLMTGGELKVDNVTIHDVVASGIRNRGGKLTGSNLTLKNIGESGISATKEGEALCTVVLDKLVTENVGAENVTADAGTVTLTNATLGSSGNNNVSIKGAELVMTDSKILGNQKTADTNIHGIMVTKGSAKLENIQISDVDAAALRVSGGEVTAANITANGGTWGAWVSGGKAAVDGLTVEGVSGENVLTDGGTANVSNATLGVSPSNSIVVRGGTTYVSDSKILGTSKDNAHGVFVTKGKIYITGVSIDGTHSGLRTKDSAEVLEATNVTMTNLRDSGVYQSAGAVKLNNVTVETPVNYGILIDNGSIDLTDVTINAPQKKDGINIAGGSVTGKNVVMEGVTAYGVFINKNAGDVSIDGLKINAAGTAVANVNVSAEQAAYAGTVTLKNAVLGKTQNNNVVLKAADAKMILNTVEIQGTKGGGAHGIYITAGTINGEKLTVTDSVAALRVNGAKAVVDVKDSTFAGVRDNGVTQTNGTVTLTNVTIDSPTNYGATVSGGTITLNSVTVNKPQNKDGISISGGAAAVNGVTINTPKNNGITVSGGTVSGQNVVIEGVTAFGINVGKSAGDISITGLRINAPDASGQQSAQAATNLQVDNGYSKTITLSGTAEADAVLGKTATNNIRTYSGTLSLNHVDIMGTAKDNAICTTASGIVTASDLEIYNTKDVALRFKDTSSFNGTDVVIANCVAGAKLHGTGSHSITGLNITGATGNNILLESGFTGTLTVNGTAEKPAYLGTSVSHSIRLYGGTINLNHVEIAGTSVSGIHGILSDKTTINATNLTIHDTKGSGLRLRDKTVFTGTNVTISNVAGDGISHASGNVEITGLKITSAGGYGIDNVATLTLKGTNNTISGCGNLAVHNYANKTITVEGGAVTGNVGNEGNMTMNASVTGAVNNTSSLTQNGAVSGTITNSGTMIQNAAVTGNITNTGTFTVGGVAVNGAVVNSGTMTMNGTTVNGGINNSGALTIGKVYVRDGLYSATVVTFTGSESAHTAADPMLLTIPEDNIKGGTDLVIFDSETVATALVGTFAVPEEYEQIVGTSVYFDGVLQVDGNVLQLFKDPYTYVAQVNGGNKYLTLAEAVAYAATVSDAQNPATVVLLEDIELESTVTVPANANIVITDNGTARKILRKAGTWSATARGVMIDVEAGATLTLQGTGTDTLILDGNKATLAPTDANWVLIDDFGNVNIGTGVVLQNNKSTRHGGAIRVESGANLNVTGGKFLNNESAGQAGGAIYVNDGAKDISIQNAHFEGNESGFHGGAISAIGGNSYGRLFVKNCTFTNNLSGKDTTANAYGGAINTYGPATIEDCSFTGNDATHGGAINGGNGAVIGITRCTFTSNTSTQTGGAVNGAGSATLNISNCTFTSNIATGNGGAVSMAKGTITGSTFTGNSSDSSGGAINSNASSAANLVITNCSVTDNTAAYGGGIYANGSAYVTLDGCTVTGNTSTGGQGADVQMAASDSKAHLVVKSTSKPSVFTVYFRNPSYMSVEGSLLDGSQITCFWYEPNFSGNNAVLAGYTGAVFTGGADVAKANFKYFSLSGALSGSYHLAVDGDKIVVKEGGAVAEVEGVVYGTLKEAIDAAAAASTADKVVTVKLIANVTVTGTITIPANANIVITDDGTARTITRGTNFNTKARGVLFDVSDGAKVKVTSTGDDTNSKLIFDGNNTNITAVNGNWAIFNAKENGTNISLTIEAGVKFMNNSSTGAGGVLRLEAGTLTVTGGVFTGNKVINNGAGVINVMSGVEANISNATFTNNSATGDGGVIYVLGGAEAIITNCVFELNTAGNNGGAIYVTANGSATIDGATFTSNEANNWGGALTVWGTDSKIEVKNSTFTENKALKESGGAILSYSNGKLTVTNCALNNNNAAKEGGAIAAWSATKTEISGGSFTGNTALRGGAIHANENSTNGVTIKNAAFNQNTATGTGDNDGGGAVYVKKNYSKGTYAVVTITGGSFTGNTASKHGGAVYVQGKLTATGASFTGNIASVNGGAIFSTVGSAADGVISNCTVTGNSAANGGGVYTPGVGYVTLDGCTVTGNTSTNSQGTDVQVAASDNTAHLVVKSTSKPAVMNVYFRNRSTMAINGDLAENSLITCYWYTPNFSANANGHTAVTFDSAEALAANRKYIRLSAANNSSYHFEVANEKTLVLKAGAEVARVNGIGYDSLAEAVEVAAAASSAENAVTVEIVNNFELSATVAIPANANIIITDDGTARTILRSTSWSGASGVMFDVPAGATLTVKGTGTDTLILDGNKANVTAVDDVDWAIVRADGTVYIGSGAVLQNNKNALIKGENADEAYGGGGAIHLQSDANLYVTGGKFLNNASTYRAGAIFVEDTSYADVQNAVFEGNNAGWHGGAICTVESAELYVKNCTFTKNTASSHGGAIQTYAKATVLDSTFTRNTSGAYGGAYNVGNTSAPIVITNCTFEYNNGNNGGAVNISGKIKNAAVTDCIFKENTSTKCGGAIYAGGTATVNGGSFTGNYAGDSDGAIGARGNKLTVNNVSFKGNGAKKYAGAIGGWSGIVEVSNSNFEGNYCGISGGATLTYNNNTFTLTNCTFTENYSTTTDTSNANGGGAIAAWHGTTNINNCQFTGNYAASGGAVHSIVNANGKTSTVVINGASFTGNNATKTVGGAIYTSQTMTFTGTYAFSGNTANGVPNDIAVNNGTLTGITVVDGMVQAPAATTGLDELDGEGTSTEGTSTEGTSTEGTSTEDTSTEDTSTEGTSTEGASTEGTSTEGTSTEGTSTEGTSTEGTSTEDTSTEGTSTEGTSTEGTSTEGTSTEGTSTEETSTEGTSTEGTSTEGTSTEGTSTEGTSTETTTTETTTTETTTTETTTTETTTTESTPSEPAEPAPETESTQE